MGHQHLWQLLQEQAEIHVVPQEKDEHPASQGTFPLPRPKQNLLENMQRYAPTIRQTEEAGRTFSSQGAEDQAKKKILRSRPSISGGRMEVPERRCYPRGHEKGEGCALLSKEEG